jgi:hypothetical protein
MSRDSHSYAQKNIFRSIFLLKFQKYSGITVKSLLIAGPQLIPEPHLIPGVVKALKQ